MIIDITGIELTPGNNGDECSGSEEVYRMKFSCRAEVEQAVAEYVQFYNFERINLKNGLTPDFIRSETA